MFMFICMYTEVTYKINDIVNGLSSPHTHSTKTKNINKILSASNSEIQEFKDTLYNKLCLLFTLISIYYTLYNKLCSSFMLYYIHCFWLSLLTEVSEYEPVAGGGSAVTAGSSSSTAGRVSVTVGCSEGGSGSVEGSASASTWGSLTGA